MPTNLCSRPHNTSEWMRNAILCVSLSHEVELHHKTNFRLHLDRKGNEIYPMLGISNEGYTESDLVRFPVFTDKADAAALAGIGIRRRLELPSSSEA